MPDAYLLRRAATGLRATADGLRFLTGAAVLAAGALEVFADVARRRVEARRRALRRLPYRRFREVR